MPDKILNTPLHTSCYVLKYSKMPGYAEKQKIVSFQTGNLFFYEIYMWCVARFGSICTILKT